MVDKIERLDLQNAKEDLQRRTLEPIGYDFGRLVYLCSLRDFSTGTYHHHGLESSFSKLTASRALAQCHEEVFNHFTLCPLNDFMEQVERFVRSSGGDFERTVEFWESLEAYRVAVPSGCDPLTAALFRSNIKIVMAVLRSRPSPRQEIAQSALQLPSPDQ